MVFTKREKIIIAATVAVLCLLVLDFYVLTPLLKERDAVKDAKARLLARFAQAKSLLDRRHVLGPKWRSMIADGLKGDPAEAESQLLRSLRNWSSEAGVKLSSLRPERSTEKTQLPEAVVHAAGTGSMSAVSRLLWRIETANIPVKVRMVQVGSRKDGTDDLSLHVKVSTLYSPGAPGPQKQVARSGGAGGGDQ
ncbi:MAG TPA: hypothetical protein VNA25_18270 [Phycisphaerae bacterium]|nr:hypothetical protein [Phycisphaerae bacterium]